MLTTAPAQHPLRPFCRQDFRRLQLAAGRDAHGVHHLTDDPGDADLILFVGAAEPDYVDVRHHAYVRNHREKCFLFDSGDRIIPYLPGVYACVEARQYNPRRVRSGFYLRVFENDWVQFSALRHDARYLFSFLGSSATARLRRHVLSLRHPRGLVREVSCHSAGTRR